MKRCFHGSLCLPSLGSFFGIGSNLGLWRRSHGKLDCSHDHVLGIHDHREWNGDEFDLFEWNLVFHRFGHNHLEFFWKRRYDDGQQLRLWSEPEFHVHLPGELAGWNGAAGIAVQFGRQYSAG